MEIKRFTCVTYVLLLLLLFRYRTLVCFAQWVFFLKFGSNKPPQISRTFRSILSVYNIALFCSFFGIAPIPPITIGVMFIIVIIIIINIIINIIIINIYYYNSHTTQPN